MIADRCPVCGAPARVEKNKTFVYRLIDATGWRRLRCSSEPPHEWQVSWNPTEREGKGDRRDVGHPTSPTGTLAEGYLAPADLTDGEPT